MFLAIATWNLTIQNFFNQNSVYISELCLLFTILYFSHNFACSYSAFCLSSEFTSQLFSSEFWVHNSEWFNWIQSSKLKFWLSSQNSKFISQSWLRILGLKWYNSDIYFLKVWLFSEFILYQFTFRNSDFFSPSEFFNFPIVTFFFEFSSNSDFCSCNLDSFLGISCNCEI